jgi:catechol 2,3-dioxygenase-like lactoylglutathione lyase family enzyme
MTILGIDEITLSAADLRLCERFFIDWGLQLVQSSALERVFESLNGCRVIVAHPSRPGLPAGIEDDPTLRQVIWAAGGGLEGWAERLQSQDGFEQQAGRVLCRDPMGLSVGVQISRKKTIDLPCAQTNTWSERPRVNRASPAYDRATPVEVGHVVLFTRDLEATSRFYQEALGFVISDRYPGRGHFLRCAPRGGHHDLFLLQPPQARQGLNHVAFTVRDVHEVIGGGLHMSRQGWQTELGPGRHPISSALFWYVVSPAGALVEYYTDEDELTQEWQPRDFTPGPTVFAEWAVKGGIDGHTRRQVEAQAPSGAFMTDKPKT